MTAKRKIITTPLSLFQIAPEQDRHKNYTLGIDIYDLMPKYVWDTSLCSGESLKIVSRKFTLKNAIYTVNISPATLREKDGSNRQYLPGRTEEIVESALRFLAVHGQAHLGNTGHASVAFTLNELQRELARFGHCYSIPQIKHAIDVNGATSVKIEATAARVGKAPTASISSNIFSYVKLLTRDSWQEDGDKAKAIVGFYPLVTEAVLSSSFRLMDYKRFMSYKMDISRYLHKVVYLRHFSADSKRPDIILNLLDIIANSGMKKYEQLSWNAKEVRKALNELQEASLIVSYTEDKIKSGRVIRDYSFTLRLNDVFFADMKMAESMMHMGLPRPEGTVWPFFRPPVPLG